MGCCNSKTHIETLSENIKEMPVYIPRLEHVPVINVYDGDTITVAVKIEQRYYKYKVRLAGIDTPELRTNNENEKRKAIAARDYLKMLILHKKVCVRNVFYEKYGRLCGTIYIKNKDINRSMVEAGHAVEYDGGKKPTW